MMRAEERLWRTRDGEGLVRDGDPDAAILAYAPGDEITKADEGNVPTGDKPKPDVEAKTEPAKAKAAPANKARQKPADK